MTAQQWIDRMLADGHTKVGVFLPTCEWCGCDLWRHRDGRIGATLIALPMENRRFYVCGDSCGNAWRQHREKQRKKS
jgi:hypothetical protein